MDDVIFEEFKGTATWKSTSDRRLVDKRVFPTIDINRSEPAGRIASAAGRVEPHLGLRKVLSPLSTVEAMELLLGRLSKTKTNGEFLASMSSPV